MEKPKILSKRQRRSQQYSYKSKVEKWQRDKDYIKKKKYEKVLKKEQRTWSTQRLPKIDDKDVLELEEAEETEMPPSPPRQHQGLSRFERIKLEKEEKKKAQEEARLRKEAAIKESKKKRLERNRKLFKKTKKGQPVMKHRIEMLLEQIQNSV